MNIVFPKVNFTNFKINHMEWYGCYNIKDMNQDKKMHSFVLLKEERDNVSLQVQNPNQPHTICIGPFMSYDITNFVMKNTINTPYTIHSTCMFMPKFMTLYKLSKQLPVKEKIVIISQ